MIMKLSALVIFSFSLNAFASELKIAITQEWGNFNPVTINLASTSAISHFVYRGLSVRNSEGEVLPDLASEIPSLKNGLAKITTNGKAKSLTAQWNIRENAKWGDGVSITCDDLILGWEIGKNSNVSVGQRSIYSNIVSISSIDKLKKKCLVKYQSADWSFDRDTPALVPSHIEMEVYNKFKNTPLAYEQNTAFIKNPSLKGLYNGPYLVKESKLGSHLILTPNSQFYGGSPKINDILFKYISDSGTLKANLKTDSINSISAVGFPPDLAISMSKDAFEKGSNYVVKFVDSPIFQGLFINNENLILSDKEMRKSLDLAINKEELTKAFFASELSPAYTFVSPKDPIFKLNKSNYNPKRAVELLTAKGWRQNSKGIFEKDGKTLSLVFRTSAGLKVLETIQTYICQNFLKVGIECVVKNQPPRVLLGDTVPNGDFDIAMFGQPVVPDSSLKGIFSSTEIPQKSNSFAGGNITRFKNQMVDNYVIEFENEWKREKRNEIFRKIEKIVSDESPFVPLYHRREAFVLPANLKGFEADISGTGFLFPEKWYF